MGVVINHTLGNETQNVKSALDHGEAVARTIKKQADTLGIEMIIQRHSDTALYIDLEGCETLAFDFKRHGEIWKDWRTEYGKQYIPFDNSPESSDHYKRWPGQITLWSSGFCKTQYGKSVLEHVWIAEIVRAVAGMCDVVKVHDEGDYYHTRKVEDAARAIGENGAMINDLVGKLSGLGFDVVKGGETVIKPSKRKK